MFLKVCGRNRAVSLRDVAVCRFFVSAEKAGNGTAAAEKASRTQELLMKVEDSVG